MVQAGVEHPFVGLGGFFVYLYFREEGFPLGQQSVVYLLERPVGNFVVCIGFGPQTAQEGDSYFKLQRMAVALEAEQGTGLLVGIILGAVCSDAVAFPGGRFTEGLVGLCIEVHGVGPAVVPTSTDAGVTAYLVVGEDLYFGTDKLLCLACIGYRAFAQEEACVNGQRLVGLRIGEAVERGPFGSRYLRPNAALLEAGVVVAQADVFVLAVVDVLCAVQCTAEGCYQDVPVLGAAARSADVYLGKAVHPCRHGQPAAVG